MDFLNGNIRKIYFRYLPVAAGADSLWLAMPITELVASVYVALNIRKYTKALPEL